MSKKKGPEHVVVDGSNIATEGRSMPSLAQLNEAVMSFMDEHPGTAITVVVDATFGHRIDKKETAEFEAGISNNELVAPPAGAVGRGDAFVLGIADKAGSSVLSNDSFQEFHGDYEWLFDEGRLIGGKPVPHVGWVWVDRVPVRGPVSRKATRGSSSSSSSSSSRSRGKGRSRRDEGTARVGSAAANSPMPVPKSPPPRKAAGGSDDSTSKQATRSESEKSGSRRTPKSGETVNELLPFLEFVEHHPAGTAVEAVVDSYSSHGAYVDIVDADVRGYVPLRMMADPTPRSAKSVMKIGESVSLVVVSFSGSRRSIDCAMPDMAAAAIAAAAEDGADDIPTSTGDASESTAPKKRASRKRAAKKTSTKKTAAKKTATRSVTKKTAAKKAAAKKVPAKKAAVKKTPAKKTAAKKTAVKKTPAKKAAVKKAAAKKTPAKKTANKKVPAKKRATSKTPVKKVAAKKPTAKKAAPRKATVKKTAATKAAGQKTVADTGTAIEQSASQKPTGVKRTPVRKTPVKKQAASIDGDS